MGQAFGRRFGAILAIAAIALASCTSAATPAPTPTPTAAATAAAATGSPAASAPATLPPGTKTFTYAQTTAGFSNAPTLAALDALKSQGYSITVVDLADADLVVQGVSKGQFQFGRGGTPEVAVQNGAKVQIVGSYAGNEWTVYAKKDIADCKGLDGKRLAIHSQSGGSTARLKGWIQSTCGGINPNYLVIAGSQNRYAALLADQIDASPLELADAVRLELEASDRFHLLANLNKTQKLPTTMYTNPDWAAQNPGTVQAFLQALLEENRKIATQQGYLAQIVTKYLPSTDKIPETAARYAEVGIFDVNGELTDDVAKGILAFNEQYGFIKPGLTVAQVFDLSYLNAVLARIGRK